LVKKAEEIRVREHRLKPSLRLKTQEEIYEFIHDRGLVSALGGNELPSFISAILGRPWKPSAKGFSGWNDWWSLKISGQSVARVSGAIERREDILAARIFRRTKTFVSKELWPTLDTIVKHHQDPTVKRRTFSDLELNLLETIETEGSIRTDRLRKQLGLEGKENNSKFHRALTNLESYALIIGAEDPHPERHLHANIWQTWDTRTSKGMDRAGLSYPEALAKLLEKTIDACVLAREDQVGKWFRWSRDMEPAKEELLRKGRLVRVRSFLMTPRVIRP
jgi:winged helix DNA-binding protein